MIGGSVAAVEPPLGLAVVGLGLHSAIGRTATSAAAAVRAGVSRLREHDHMVDREGDPFRVADDAELGAPLQRSQRIAALATSAIEQVVQQIETRKMAGRIPTLLCLPEACDTFSEADGVSVCTQVNQAFAGRLELGVRPVMQGNAAAAAAVQSAHALLSTNNADACIVAGADSFIDPDVLEPLDESGRMMSLSNRWGFPPGEGAGALLLVSKAKVRGLGFPPLAELHGLGMTREPHGRDSDGVCVGAALADAFRQSVKGLGQPVAAQYNDIDGDRYREHEFSFAITRVHADMFDNATDYVAPADAWGAVGAASLVMLSALAIARGHRGPVPGATWMAWAGSEGGLRGSLVYREVSA